MTVPELAPATAAPASKQAKRATSPQATLKMITQRQSELAHRLPIYQAVEAAYDREPTDSREALEIDGLGWTCTIDWGGMKAGVDQGALVDYNLATQPETYVKLKPRRDGQGVLDRLAAIEDADKELLDSWEPFQAELEMMVHNRRAHGLGIFHFPHPVGWHFKSVHPASLVYPANAKINVEDWDWFALCTEFKIVDLLARLEEPEPAQAIGWNLSNVRKVIAKLKDGTSYLRGMMADPEHYAVELKTGDLAFAAKNKSTVKGYAFYVREWNGRVSEHFVVNDEEIGFLFSGVDRHESMASCISLFPLAMGQGFVERVRGYGVEMLPYHDTENRARNHMLDQVLASGVVLKSMDGDDSRRGLTGMRHHGPFLFMDEGIEVAAAQLPEMSNTALKVLGEMERTRANNNQAFGGTDHAQRNSDMSATQSRILHQSNSTAESNEVARFYNQLGRFHTIRLRRTLQQDITALHPGGKAAMEMVQELTEQGVTMADFQNIKRVLPRTIFGDGNAINQWLAMEDVSKWYGSFTSDGKQAFVQRAVAARLRDPELANLLTGAGARIDQRGQANRWAAQMENNVFETSDTRQDLGPNDDHVIHLDVHTTYAEEVQKREDLGLQEQFQRVHRTQAHAAVHLAELAQDMNSRELFKDFNQRWANVANWLRQVGQQLAAENERLQAEQMEEMRNPKPKVKDQELMMTEQLRRDLMEQAEVKAEERKQKLHEAEMQRIGEKRAMSTPVAKPSAAI
jgi:hypothetical protein